MSSVEVLIPVGGQSIALFALSKDDAASSAGIDLDSIKAFILDGTVGMNIKEKVWHWLPYSLSEKAYFAVVLRNKTHKEDLEIVDLKKTLDLSISLAL